MNPHRPTDQVVVPSRATKGFEGEGERQNTNNGRQLSPATNSLHHHDPSPSLVLLLGGIISVTATGSPFHSKIIIVILISPFVSPLISIHLRGTKERQLQRVIFTAAGVILSADGIFPNDWQRKNIADQKTKLKAAKFSWKNLDYSIQFDGLLNWMIRSFSVEVEPKVEQKGNKKLGYLNGDANGWRGWRKKTK